ncbi:formyltransferase family protein [Chloroflexota bacterium]
MNERVVLIGSPHSLFAAATYDGIRDALKGGLNFTFLGVIATSPYVRRRFERAVSLVRQSAARVLNPEWPFCTARLSIPAKDIAVVSENINDPSFVTYIRDTLKPSVTISVSNHQILKDAVIEQLGYIVNYHDSLLPEYGGVSSTEFAHYYSEPFSGYTFHKIADAGIDTGNIITSGSIPQGNTGPQERVVKTRILRTVIPAVLERLFSREEGTPQYGTGSYFNRNELRRLTGIDDADSTAEVQRRIEAFGSVRVNSLPVTRIAPLGDTVFRIERINYMPVFRKRVVTLGSGGI